MSRAMRALARLTAEAENYGPRSGTPTERDKVDADFKIVEAALLERERLQAAWVDPGRRPKIHAVAQRKLRETWPTLARALDAMRHP